LLLTSGGGSATVVVMNFKLEAGGVAALAAGAGVIYMAIRTIVIPYLVWSRAWLSAPGEVVAVGESYGSGDFREHPVDVTFETFDGQAHRMTLNNRTRYEVGTAVVGHYNPRDFTQAMIWPRLSSDRFGATGMVFFGLCFCAGGIALMFKGLFAG
jgi:hypothetical protein